MTMPKVSGIDFSSLSKFRTAVTVRLFDGKEVDLPLIKLRDAGIAQSLIHRNDALSVRYNTLYARLQYKAETIGELADKITDEDTEDSKALKTEKGFSVIDDNMSIITDMQKRMKEVSKEFAELYDEIVEFITPYLKDTGVMEQLSTVDPSYTTKVLMLMLEGEDALKAPVSDDKDGTEENPTTAPSQNS